MCVIRFGGSGEDRGSGPGDGPRAAALEIADAVDVLAALWSLAAHKVTLRLSVHQFRALHVVQAAPGMNLTALAERLAITLPTASRLCDRLEAAGLLERAPHPRNRREVRLGVTAQGRQVLDDVARRRAQDLAAVLTVMRPEDRTALSGGLRAFLAAHESALQEPADDQ
ncbi:hypothetical protein GCM10023257_16280 [Streptomyces hyderabadensis]|uniref:HTH marR-type domain-containing protein n=1 Tax=Streptomyces hyderabadensis TaxID=598549 RepID=A0ABP9HUR3_9ACTN